MNFIWKNSLFENINNSHHNICDTKIALIYTLISSIIYVNKNRFIIVYNSLFRFISTSTPDDNNWNLWENVNRKQFANPKNLAQKSNA